MEWWTVFFWIRKVIFGFIAITSLFGAIGFSVYISREWPHFNLFQRILLLVVIGIDMFASVLLYLMIVVVFRIWLDLARMLFLLLLHAGTAVMFTLYAHSFSCAIFATKQLCQNVNLSFVIGSWAVAGLNLFYTIYLLIMVPVRRPLPKVPPNLLLDSYTSNQRSSMASVNSATRLVRRNTTASRYSSAPADLEWSRSQTLPKRLYLPNANVSPASVTMPGSSSYRQSGGKYGAMGTAGRPPPAATAASRAGSIRTVSMTFSRVPPSLQSSFSRRSTDERRNRGSLTLMPSNPPPLPNPFFDPVSRYGTPHSAYSTISYNADPQAVPGQFGLERYQPLVPLPQYTAYGYAEYGPPQVPSLPSASMYPDPNHFPPPRSPYITSGFRSTGERFRADTVTPQSIHSVAASMSPTDAATAMHYAFPHPAHTRGTNDPVYRPYTASPHVHTQTAEDALPNPFPPLVGRGEVRRFGSLSGPDGAAYPAGHGSTYMHDARNATQLAGMLGRAPPRATPVATDAVQWKQLVLSAALGETV